MILFKLVFAIVKKVLLALAFVAFLSLLVTFFIALANNSGLEGGFLNAFWPELENYVSADNLRLGGVIVMVVGLVGGLVLSILAILFKKAGFWTLLFGLASIIGAIMTYTTLTPEPISGFFSGAFAPSNYVVVFTLLFSLTITIVGLYHVIYGLSARLG